MAFGHLTVIYDVRRVALKVDPLGKIEDFFPGVCGLFWTTTFLNQLKGKDYQNQEAPLFITAYSSTFKIKILCDEKRAYLTYHIYATSTSVIAFILENDFGSILMGNIGSQPIPEFVVQTNVGLIRRKDVMFCVPQVKGNVK